MRSVVITGAANGLGKAIAEKLKDENLILVDKDEKALIKIAKKLNSTYLVCDVANVEDVKKLKKYVEKLNSFDTLINCAGVWNKGDLSRLDDKHIASLNKLETIKNIIDTNTYGTIATITALSPILIKNGKGQIINISSQSAVETEEFCPVYNASKHGEYYYRKAIQRDLAKHNVKITDVLPGLMNTNFFVRAKDPLPEEVMKTQGLNPEDVAACVKYVLDLPPEITMPSIEIRHIKNF